MKTEVSGVATVLVDATEGGSFQSSQPTIGGSVIVGLHLPTITFKQGVCIATLLAKRDEVSKFCHETLSLLSGGPFHVGQRVRHKDNSHTLGTVVVVDERGVTVAWGGSSNCKPEDLEGA